ncbi:hypothetical protein K443DRAFT_687108 [Laccaria amethystina LaAM-08-1]|uniref:Uncharacterized protein n=1 Tax=Laccaria amethystina LaAM-08-1 TaxID=1095629 RepID=A0A0C9WKY7_9AGAR|nr:hypothetical protein K443DRAFT_687108 [Laccaria amethystina LaAM-08-1]
MSSLPPQSRSSEGRGSDLLDGRGRSTKAADTAKAPRYLYYRLYTKDGAIRSINPIYANNEFIGRTRSRFITPPHTVLSVKNHLCKIEGFNAGTSSTLIESFSDAEAMDASARVLLKGDSGPGLSEDDPMILVVEPRGDEKRTLSLKQGVLPNSVPHEPRYLYYQIYDKGGVIATKMSFDTEEEFLGRVDTLSVTPPHTVASLRSRIASAEGVVKSKIQMFKDTDGDALMNDDDKLSLLAQTYTGCAEDEPIAVVVYENELQVGENNTFSRQIRSTRAFTPGSENLSVWLATTDGEILHTDGVRITQTYIGNPGPWGGYMAINASGKKGFIMETAVKFC